MGNSTIISSGWPAPAKLNLCLRITGRRADGYHQLQTLFQLVHLCDCLDFEIIGDTRIHRTANYTNVAEGDDLVVRAATALQQAARSLSGVSITVHKKIPMGAGLGGGSSNAASTLVALNHLWRCNFSLQQLADIGMKLGADIPLFVHGRSAWGEGVGERLLPVSLDQTNYLIIYPGISVATRAVFAAPDLTRNTPPITMDRLGVTGTIRGVQDMMAAQGQNDCESVVRRLVPAVSEAQDWLSRYAKAHITGTGSSVFAAFADHAKARHIIARLPAGWRGFLVAGCDMSPLLERLEKEKIKEGN